MLVLLDEQLPRHLAREIGGHNVSTVQQRGWAGLKNGELLRVAADAGFEVLVTADRNLQISPSLGSASSCLSRRAMLLKIFFHSFQICLPRFSRQARADYCG
jgi:Domain of unknown function (DUF5615)